MSGKFTEDVLDSTEIYDGAQGSHQSLKTAYCQAQVQVQVG